MKVAVGVVAVVVMATKAEGEAEEGGAVAVVEGATIEMKTRTFPAKPNHQQTFHSLIFWKKSYRVIRKPGRVNPPGRKEMEVTVIRYKNDHYIRY